MEIYWRLPVFLQEAALGIYARQLDRDYYGKDYEKWQRRYEEWRGWSRGDAETWQVQELRALVKVAATRVPYYRETWRGTEWQSVGSLEDLRRLPVLDKHSIRQNERAFIAEGIKPRSLWMGVTSGTTGTALRIYWPKSMLPKWWAISEVMIRNVAGVAQQFPRAMMGGRPVVHGATSQPPYWRFNRHWRQLYLSSYHVSPRTSPDYAAAIRRYRSEWITGYGSAIAALAESALAAGVASVPLRSAIVSGDTLMPNMRSSIERFFRCKCFDNYGQSEGASLAMECSEGRMHIVPAVGIMEILRDDGSPCAPGEVGEIVATGLLNDAMPLIRYRTGDYAAWSEQQNCECGNVQPVIYNLEGRTDDYLVTVDGRKIGRLSTAIKRSPSIHSAQIVQDATDHAYLLVRPGKAYQTTDAVAVCDDITSRIGKFNIDIAEVSEIPKTPQGKLSLVVRLADRPWMRATYENLLGLNSNGTVSKVEERKEVSRVAVSDAPLRDTDVVILTSGHEITDSRIYARIACGVKRLGANVTLVGRAGHATEDNIAVVNVPEPSSRLSRFLWQPWRCLWAMRHLHPHIIHFHDAELLITLPVAKLWRRQAKFVYDVHEDFANLMLIRDWLPSWLKPVVRIITNAAEKALALLADAIVGVTPPLAEKFFNREKAVAYNYVCDAFFRQAAETSHPAHNREFDLVHLGTLNNRRALFLAETLREFHSLRPEARSLIVGVSRDIEVLLRERIPQGCVLLGHTAYDQIPTLLGNAKVGLDVHPWLGTHLKVALPVKVCEYMAAGCAVVCSSMPVLDQLLRQCGTLSGPIKIISGGSPADYARAADGLITLIGGGADPGSELRQIAVKNMLWENEANKIARLYLRLLGKPCAI